MNKDLALKFTQARIDKGMTVSELAEASSVKSTTINALENGYAGVTLSDLVCLASALGLTVDVKFGKGDQT